MIWGHAWEGASWLCHWRRKYGPLWAAPFLGLGFWTVRKRSELKISVYHSSHFGYGCSVTSCLTFLQLRLSGRRICTWTVNQQTLSSWSSFCWCILPQSLKSKVSFDIFIISPWSNMVWTMIDIWLYLKIWENSSVIKVGRGDFSSSRWASGDTKKKMMSKDGRAIQMEEDIWKHSVAKRCLLKGVAVTPWC